LVRVGASPVLAFAAGSVLGVVAGLWQVTWWRRALLGLGFPASLVALGVWVLPAWAWLLPLALLLLLYPVRAWRDAPLFPTPIDALNGLVAHIKLAPGALVLDAGCGLGDGLRALRRVYPQARLAGIEWSALLRVLAALRCPWAQVRQGDIWQADWSGYAMVYVFQRPESMARAAAKARAELAAGAWLVSLEFEATTLVAHACLPTPQGKPLWLYRMPV
jgi:SAM-dependent methyltransferase